MHELKADVQSRSLAVQVQPTVSIQTIPPSVQRLLLPRSVPIHSVQQWHCHRQECHRISGMGQAKADHTQIVSAPNQVAILLQSILGDGHGVDRFIRKRLIHLRGLSQGRVRAGGDAVDLWP
jgi:hypothetical protein